MYTPKNWQNWPSTATRRDAAAMIAQERRAANYAGAVGLVGPGAGGYEDFRVKQRILGATMSVDVGIAASENVLLVPVDGGGGVQRYEYSGTQINVPLATADETNPRIDRIVGEAPTDPDDLAPLISVLTGVPTVGATLANKTGALFPGPTRVLLADILVGAGVLSVLTANILDRRPAGLVFAPPILTDRDEVIFEAKGAPCVLTGAAASTHDNMQAAALMYLPRRVVGATRIRWKYRQGGTAAATNYALGIYDVSGQQIVAISSTFSGSASATVEHSLTIGGGLTFEAGLYYVVLGLAAMTASSSIGFTGVSLAIGASNLGPSHRNVGLRSSTGGTTLPAQITAMTDVAGLTADTNVPGVPLVSLGQA